jgi:hypothetical protein
VSRVIGMWPRGTASFRESVFRDLSHPDGTSLGMNQAELLYWEYVQKSTDTRLRYPHYADGDSSERDHVIALCRLGEKCLDTE